MSFRISLSTKDNVTIFLVVIRNQININFQSLPSDESGHNYELRANMVHLISNHMHLDHLQKRIVRGKDPEHIKRHHLIAEETRVPHYHIGYISDVTPEMLAQFLQQLLLAQKIHTKIQYQFVAESEAHDIVIAYTEFYTKFNGSTLQRDFLEERQLTSKEKESLVKSQEEELGDLSESDIQELKACGFTTIKPSPYSFFHHQIRELDALLAALGRQDFTMK